MAKKKVIKMQLSERSINNAIREIETYKQTLLFKTEQLLEELGKIGIRTIDSSMANITGDSNPNHYAYVKLNAFGGNVRATIILQGKDIAFIEFGAGVTYNGAVGSSAYDRAGEMGYTIGSYGKGQGANESWVYYSEEYGRFINSKGTKAATPMYNADREIIKELRNVARRVFGG